jgi:hypothetical protein
MRKKTAAENAARKNGLPVKTNVKAGDFWDSLRSMSSSAYNTLTGALTGSSDSSSTASGK